MNLDTSTWKEFPLTDYFDVSAGRYYYPDEYEEGSTPYISASNTDNGVSAYINLPPDFEGNCITTGKVGCTAFYQPSPFCATSDVNIIRPKFNMHPFVGLFITQVINFNENYRWDYGRQCRVGDTKEIVLKLPATPDDEPDWKWMEDYVKSLHSEHITTKQVASNSPELNTNGWKPFLLNRLFDTHSGNGLDANKTSDLEPVYNYISRSSSNNGVVGFVDKIDGIEPSPAGSITLALGGEYLGASFVQVEPCYTAEHMGILEPLVDMSIWTKLFIATLIKKESRTLYQAFGRELDRYFRTVFTVKLPIQKDDSGNPIIDASKTFSDDGYMPDWEWMENYMKSLPYGDRIG